MPPMKNQQNEDEMEEIRKSLSFMSEEISKEAKRHIPHRADPLETDIDARPDPKEK